MKFLARIEQANAQGHAQIQGQHIYILPSRYGIMFAILLFLMLIGSVNYGNNPAFLLTFFLASLAVNSIYMTWRNLRGLQIQYLGCEAVFRTQKAQFRFRLKTGDSRQMPAIQLSFEQGEAIVEDIRDTAGVLVTLSYDSENRGRLDPGRLVISTRYPLGLFRAWCYVDSQAECLVYPAPGTRWQAQSTGQEGERNPGEKGRGSEDFAGLRGYRNGDSPKQIDWKTLARERGLYTKEFVGEQAQSRWLDWYQMAGGDSEQKLSLLCRGVLDSEQAGTAYGLRMPGHILEPDIGQRHKQVCLQALALYGLDT